jgi:hypothetical protein
MHPVCSSLGVYILLVFSFGVFCFYLGVANSNIMNYKFEQAPQRDLYQPGCNVTSHQHPSAIVNIVQTAVPKRNETALPIVVFTQSHVDGFWSSARFVFLSFWLAQQIRKKVEFDLGLPILAYKEHGEFSTAFAEFSTLFDIDHLARTLHVNTTMMNRFQEMNRSLGVRVWMTEKEAFLFRKNGQPHLTGFRSPSLCPANTTKLVDVVVGKPPQKSSRSADVLQRNIGVVQSNPGAKIVFVGPPVSFEGVQPFGKVRHFLNGTSPLPSNIQATFEAAYLFRFSRPIQKAATFVLREWGIEKSNFMAIHIRRGNTYAIEGQAGQVTLQELMYVFKRAVNTSGCNYPSAIVLSALRNSVKAEIEAFKKDFPHIRIFHFDKSLQDKVKNISGLKDCGSICLDLVEMAVWLKAGSFIGTKSTMSEFAFLMRMQQRGLAQKDHCSFDAQPCFSPDKSYYRLSPSERIACKNM